MGFFDEIKKFKNQLDHIESSVYSGKLSLMEVYERNARLEAEIALRTRELDRANKQMLTLQHIWDMMNSSKPLSSVLNAIVNSLQGELGYLYSFVVRQKADTEGEFLRIVASSREDFRQRFKDYFNCDLSEFRMKFPEISEIKNSVDNGEIYQSANIEKLILSLI